MRQIIFLCMIISMAFSQVETLTRIKIDRKTETQLSTLFESKPQKIELFETSDGLFVVEAEYEDQKLVKRISDVEYRELLSQEIGKYAILENARVPYLIGQTFLGLTVYSWTVPQTLYGDANTEQSKAFTATIMFTPIIYAGANFLLTRNMNITSGSAYGSFLGGIEGAVHGGVGFHSVRMAFPFSIAENFADFALGQNMGLTPAMFQRKCNHVIYGYTHYFAIKTLIDNEFLGGDNRDTDMLLSTATSVLEGYTSLLLSRKADYLTFGDALFELRASISGSSAIPAILMTLDFHNIGSIDFDERIYAGAGIVGYVGGYYVGNMLSKNYDLSASSSLLTYFVPFLADGLVGGIAVLLEKEGFTNSIPSIMLVTDLGLTYYLYKSLAKPQSPNPKPEGNGLNFFLNPAPLVCKNDVIRRMPILGFSCSF